MAETEDSPMPTLVRWPPEAMITPVETEVKKPQLSEDDNDSAVIPCKLWFFSACLRFDNINILGWKITFPPGIYPPYEPFTQKLDMDLLTWHAVKVALLQYRISNSHLQLVFKEIFRRGSSSRFKY
ncbi:hypothetical protein CISG_04045 [Coccidioides immitis RMSCC 3703]|uniref:Uncharacterized protein n=1 Tax=Coccidioides immitis RMSCC 3703 TaxID=454286 RepID=A0A0J8QNU1_COCIT|nr:hypothetical protein CISG_04045 [Coccidioides immitis RMSCC 3703]